MGEIEELTKEIKALRKALEEQRTYPVPYPVPYNPYPYRPYFQPRPWRYEIWCDNSTSNVNF